MGRGKGDSENYMRAISNKVGLDVVSLSGWFVVCVIVSVDKERNIEVS